MPAVFDDGDVDVDDVAFFQLLVTGNAMANLVVDRGANGFGVGVVAAGVVVQGRRNGLLDLRDVVEGQFVQFIGGDARLHVRGQVIQHFRGQATSHTHASNALFVFVSDHGWNYLRLTVASGRKRLIAKIRASLQYANVRKLSTSKAVRDTSYPIF